MRRRPLDRSRCVVPVEWLRGEEGDSCCPALPDADPHTPGYRRRHTPPFGLPYPAETRACLGLRRVPLPPLDQSTQAAPPWPTRAEPPLVPWPTAPWWLDPGSPPMRRRRSAEWTMRGTPDSTVGP